MQICLKDPSAPDNSVAEAAWSLYWYKVWQSHQESQTSQSLSGKPTIPTSQQHLAAYLQEPCYWAGWSAAQRFPKLEFRLSDYFQVVGSETTRVLKGFNPQFGIGLQNCT
jgi:hypothetical protein